MMFDYEKMRTNNKLNYLLTQCQSTVNCVDNQ